MTKYLRLLFLSLVLVSSAALLIRWRRVVGFTLASGFGAVCQPGDAGFAPAPMPCPDGVGGDGDHVRHLLRFVSQMQQADGNRALAHFRMGRIVDGLLDVGKLLWGEGEVVSSAHV